MRESRCIIRCLIKGGADRQVLTDHKVDAGTTSPNDFAIMVKAPPVLPGGGGQRGGCVLGKFSSFPVSFLFCL